MSKPFGYKDYNRNFSATMERDFKIRSILIILLTAPAEGSLHCPNRVL